MVQLLASLCHRYLARLTTHHTKTNKCRTEVCVSKALPFNCSMIWYDITTLHTSVGRNISPAREVSRSIQTMCAVNSNK